MIGAVPGWALETRSDGVRVKSKLDGTWAIEHPDGRRVVVCPCCGKLLPTARSAQLVANGLWPIDGDGTQAQS